MIRFSKASDILNNKEEYDSILKGTAGSILVTRKNVQIAINRYHDDYKKHGALIIF